MFTCKVEWYKLLKLCSERSISMQKRWHSSPMSTDVGGVPRARAFAKKLSDAPLAIVDKRRHGHNVAEVMNFIGDVKGKVAVMVDDMIDTARTITKGAALLHQSGAGEVYACSTHAVFSPPAIEQLSNGLFQEVIITNTIPLAEQNYFPQLTVLSVANLLGETIWRVHDDCSKQDDSNVHESKSRNLRPISYSHRGKGNLYKANKISRFIEPYHLPTLHHQGWL